MCMINTSEKGFTIVEILIVLAVIGILSSIAIPSYMSYKQKAYNSSALSYMQFITKAEENYWLNSQVYISAPAGDGPTASGILPNASVPSGVGFVIGTFPNLGSDTETGYDVGTDYTAFAGHNNGDRIFAVGSGSDGNIQWRSLSSGTAAAEAKAEDITQPIPSNWGQTL